MDVLLRTYIMEALSELDEDPTPEEGEELDEFSGAASVAGFSLPLGASPHKPSEPYVPPSRKLGKG